MHNLFLGTAKHFFEILIEYGSLDEHKLQIIEERQKRIKIPSYIGRVSKSSMKADEWKVIITYNFYYIFGLK